MTRDNAGNVITSPTMKFTTQLERVTFQQAIITPRLREGLTGSLWGDTKEIGGVRVGGVRREDTTVECAVCGGWSGNGQWIVGN